MQQDFLLTGLVSLICIGMFLSFFCKSFKILEETKSKFIFQIQPTFSWIICSFFGGIALIATLGTLIISPITVLDCTHFSSELVSSQHNTSCELGTINWVGKKQDKNSISKLHKAFLESKLETNNDNELFNGYRVALVTGQGNIPLTESYTSSFVPEYQNLLTIVARINSFVEKSLEDSLTIQQDEKLVGYIGFTICGLFWLLTFLLIVTAPYITCSFDREADSVTIERRNFFGKKTFQCKTNDIAAVDVEEQSDGESTTCRLKLLLKSGESWPLTYVLTSGWQEKQQIANRLRKFLEI